jgi:hypothetical protein
MREFIYKKILAGAAYKSGKDIFNTYGSKRASPFSIK